NKLVPLAIQGINEIINTIDILNAPTTTSSLIIDQNGRFGIATTTPTNILTIGQGRGNAIADGWDVYSSKKYKTDITYLEEQDYADILDEIEEMNVATYKWKVDVIPAEAGIQTWIPNQVGDDTRGDSTNLGIIAEEAPERVLSEDGKSISLYDYATFAIAGVKAVKSEVDKMKDLLGIVKNEDGTLSMIEENPSTSSGTTSLSGLVLDSEGYAVIDKIRSKNIETENLKIKAENAMQSGITIYDSKTGEPYCLYTEYGVPTTRSGECDVVLGDIEPIIPDKPVIDVILNDSEGSIDSSVIPQNDIGTTTPDVVTEPVASTTPDVVTDTPDDTSTSTVSVIIE
ncbi:MAG: tail fiber domain-containing protein, partial [Patescibacteria group bacterium]